jgi:hypothetical protein
MVGKSLQAFENFRWVRSANLQSSMAQMADASLSCARHASTRAMPVSVLCGLGWLGVNVSAQESLRKTTVRSYLESALD